jgi:hypothetical protein
MKCSRCQADSPPGTRFCGQCAALLGKPAQPRFTALQSRTWRPAKSSLSTGGLLEERHDIRTVQELLGHRDVSTTIDLHSRPQGVRPVSGARPTECTCHDLRRPDTSRGRGRPGDILRHLAAYPGKRSAAYSATVRNCEISGRPSGAFVQI